MKYMRLARCFACTAALLLAAACGGDDGSGPDTDATPQNVSFSVAVSGSSGGGPAGPAAIDFSDGQNNLSITRVAMVLREVELKKEFDDFCEDSGPGADTDDCEEFEVGPFVLELPLDGQVEQLFTIQPDPGTYDELEFEVHKPDDDSQADLAFLQAHPEFVDVSVRVEGTYNGNPFVFLQDLNEEQEIDLFPPLIVEEGSPAVNVTMTVDIAGWFLVEEALVDPNAANKGETFEGAVEENIRRSIEAFRDDDRDGDDAD